jgi:PPOX class probable F420-dependent enzyme
MSPLSPELKAFLDTQIMGVLATQAANGRPRQSVVYYTREGERLLISTVAGRRKTADVERTAWASLCVMGHERPFPSATFSGAAEILTADIGAATAAIAQRLMGTEQPPEPQSDEALAAVGRVILAITIERVAAVNYLDG